MKQDGEPNGVSRALQARLCGAGARARQARPAHRHVHLVHLPRPRDERLAERAPDDERRREAVADRFPVGCGLVDARNAILTVRGGVASPPVTVYLRAYGAGTRPGETVGFNVKVRNAGKLVASSSRPRRSGCDATATFRLTGFRPVKGRTYTVEVQRERPERRRRDAEAHADADREVARSCICGAPTRARTRPGFLAR